MPNENNRNEHGTYCPGRYWRHRRVQTGGVGRCADARGADQLRRPPARSGGPLHGQRVAFLARHGEGHSIPPHKINYRANLAALKQLGASRVLALNTVGGIGDNFGPRVLACPDQLIDYTWGRISTLSEEEGSEVLHVDFGHPHTPSFRAKVFAAAKAKGVAMQDGGCYGATQGPRLETDAEIGLMRRDGCDLVGMTGMPGRAGARIGGGIRLPGHRCQLGGGLRRRRGDHHGRGFGQCGRSFVWFADFGG